jgi:hypothetical protein
MLHTSLVDKLLIGRPLYHLMNIIWLLIVIVVTFLPVSLVLFVCAMQNQPLPGIPCPIN